MRMAATDNSIALGAKSVTDTAVSTSSGVIGGRTYSFAGGNAVGTLSIGDSGAERTITNVAAGRYLLHLLMQPMALNYMLLKM